MASVAAAVTVQLLSHQEAAKKEIDLQVEMKVPWNWEKEAAGYYYYMLLRQALILPFLGSESNRIKRESGICHYNSL